MKILKNKINTSDLYIETIIVKGVECDIYETLCDVSGCGSNCGCYAYAIANSNTLGNNTKNNKKISIPFSEEDLQELLRGETFDWTFDSIDVHLYMGEEE